MEEKLLFEITEHSHAFDGPNSQTWLPASGAEPHRQITRLRLKIYAISDGFALTSESSNPSFSGGDTWHHTLDEAFAQAKSAFGVSAGSWQRVAA
jgi:hypothetical protein